MVSPVAPHHGLCVDAPRGLAETQDPESTQSPPQPDQVGVTIQRIPIKGSSQDAKWLLAHRSNRFSDWFVRLGMSFAHPLQPSSLEAVRASTLRIPMDKAHPEGFEQRLLHAVDQLQHYSGDEPDKRVCRHMVLSLQYLAPSILGTDLEVEGGRPHWLKKQHAWGIITNPLDGTLYVVDVLNGYIYKEVPEPNPRFFHKLRNPWDPKAALPK